MEGEIGTLTKIGIGVMLVGIIVSVVFLIIGFTRGAVNQGVSKLQSGVDQMSMSQFDDYDQQPKKGTDILATLKLFESQPYAIIVRTTAQMGSAANTGFNYGAMLAGSSTTTFITPTMSKAAGQSWFVQNLAVDASGTKSYNLNVLPTKTTGTNAFIRPTASFLAELIKDSTGTITGICFTQQN